MNIFFSLFKNVNIRVRRDLEYFLKMPSNPCSEKENEVAEYILKNAKYNDLVTDEAIVKQFFSCKEEWYRVKHRIQETFLRYFTMQKLEKHPIRAVLLAEIYDECGQEHKKNSAIKKQRKRLKADPNKALYEYLYEEMGRKERRDQRKKISDLSTVEQKLDEFYLERKLAYLTEKMNRKDIVNKPSLASEDLDFYNWATKKVMEINATKTNIYYELYTLLRSTTATEAESVKKIEQMIEDNDEEIDSPNLEKYYSNLLNFYIKELNQGRSEYAEYYLSCLSKVLDLGLIFPEKQLTVKDLKNAVGISLISQNTVYAWKLIRQHENKPLYKKGEGQNFISLMKAIVLFNEGKYVESLSKITNYRLSDINDDIEWQFLKLQLDYTLQRGEPILKNIQVLYNRIKRNRKLALKKKKAHLLFLESFRQIVKREQLDLANLKGKISILKYRWLEKMLARE